MPGNLHDMGYGMPRNIPLADVLDPTKARQLAGQYVTGYTANKQFTTPLQQLVAYNAGPDFAEQWIASGANVEDLPEETKSYIRRAAEYLQNLRNNDMAMMSMDVDTDPNITIDGQVISPLMQKLAEAQQAASMARTRQARMRASSNYEHQCLPSRFHNGITATGCCCTISGGTRCGHGHDDGDACTSTFCLPISTGHHPSGGHTCSERRHYRQGTSSHQHTCSL